MSKRPLSFRPSEEEEIFLSRNGKLDNWTDTIRKWIEQDKKLGRKQLLDKLSNNMILVFTGVIAFMFGYIMLFIHVELIPVFILISVIAAVAVTYGVISIIWEIILNVRRD